MNDPGIASFQCLQSLAEAVELEAVAVLFVDVRGEIAANRNISIKQPSDT